MCIDKPWYCSWKNERPLKTNFKKLKNKTRTGMSSSLFILSKWFWQCFSSWQDVYRGRSCTGLSNCQHWTLFSVENHYFRICWRNIGREKNFLGSDERFTLNAEGFFFLSVYCIPTCPSKIWTHAVEHMNWLLRSGRRAGTVTYKCYI